MKHFYPERIVIELYHGCNVRCIMCPIHKSTRQKGAMSLDIFLEILRQICEFKERLKVVSLYMMGEPLLDKFLEGRISQCKTAGLSNVGFSTNAGILSGARAEQIIDADPDWIAFSFESIDKATYESIRVGLRFDDVYNNIFNFIELRNRRKSNMRISMRFIEQPKNESQFAEYFKHFGNLLTNEQDEILYFPLISWDNGKKTFGNSPCDFLFNRLVIHNDGTIPLCCIDYNATYRLGNITDRSLLDIWNSPTFSKIRTIHKSGGRGNIKLCETCNDPELISKRYYHFK